MSYHPGNGGTSMNSNLCAFSAILLLGVALSIIPEPLPACSVFQVGDGGKLASSSGDRMPIKMMVNNPYQDCLAAYDRKTVRI